MIKYRSIKEIFKGIRTTDGAGVNLTRIIGGPDLNMLDPFLLLDEFGTDNPDDYIRGFPSHPHRGFETITYMLNGNWQHKDSVGNEGILRDGSVQWMTAGRGVIHSEMPIQTEGLARGFQLWLNLPKSKKMMEPGYQDIDLDQIPVVSNDSGKVKVISGDFQNLKGPGLGQTPTLILDIKINQNSEITFPAPNGWNAFAYVYDGEALIGEKLVSNQLAVFDHTGHIHIQSRDKSSSVYFAAGEPLNEPVARGGPFVMNTKEEILRAFADFQEGRF